jgi:hypothetical protein
MSWRMSSSRRSCMFGAITGVGAGQTRLLYRRRAAAGPAPVATALQRPGGVVGQVFGWVMGTRNQLAAQSCASRTKIFARLNDS